MSRWKWFLFILCIALIVGVCTWVLVWSFTSPHARRQRVHRAIEQCHARGPQYHYWDERGRCVLYIQEGP